MTEGQEGSDRAEETLDRFDLREYLAKLPENPSVITEIARYYAEKLVDVRYDEVTSHPAGEALAGLVKTVSSVDQQGTGILELNILSGSIREEYDNLKLDLLKVLGLPKNLQQAGDLAQLRNLIYRGGPRTVSMTEAETLRWGEKPDRVIVKDKYELVTGFRRETMPGICLELRLQRNGANSLYMVLDAERSNVLRQSMAKKGTPQTRTS